MTSHVSTGAPDRIVVVGGGMAGTGIAGELRTRGYTGTITMIDAGEFPYDRPPLSKGFLLGTQDFEKIKLVADDWFDANKVELRAGRSAVGLRPGEGVVELDDGSVVAADAVFLGTGGDARPLPCAGGDLPGVHVLRMVEHAQELQGKLVPGARVVVIGGGLIGAEVVSTSLKLGCEVTLVEPVTPLVPAVGPLIAEFLHGQHAAAGVRIIADLVAEITKDGDALTVTTRSGESATADVVVAGIGMVAPSQLAATAGLEIDRAVVVDTDYRTSNPAVFAAGDAVRMRMPDGTLVGKEHWQAARQGGVAAASTMIGLPQPELDPDWFWTDRHGVHVEAVGSMLGDRQLVRGEPGGTPISVFNIDPESGQLLGVAAVDDGKAIMVGRRMLKAGTVPDPELLTDPATDLKVLLKKKR